jgi:hypothetical protein
VTATILKAAGHAAMDQTLTNCRVDRQSARLAARQAHRLRSRDPARGRSKRRGTRVLDKSAVTRAAVGLIFLTADHFTWSYRTVVDATAEHREQWTGVA